VTSAGAADLGANALPLLAYQMNSTSDPASSTPMTMLKSLAARSDRRNRWTVAPKTSQTKQLGSEAKTNTTPNQSDCTMVPAASVCQYVPTALVLISHDLGLTHCKAAACQEPTPSCAAPASPWGAVAILQDTQRSKSIRASIQGPSRRVSRSGDGWLNPRQRYRADSSRRQPVSPSSDSILWTGRKPSSACALAVT